MIEIPNGNDNDTRSASLEEATTTYTCQTRYCHYCYVATLQEEEGERRKTHHAYRIIHDVG
jgi:hypothetical protein